MPVITRLKAKSLQSLPILSSHMESSTMISTQSLSPINVNNQSKSYYDALTIHPELHCSSSSFEIFEFQNSHGIGVKI
jgi:hypothetical protein